MSSRPSLDDISVVLAHLADRVMAERGTSLEPLIIVSLERAVAELKFHIPGWYMAADLGAANALAAESRKAQQRGRSRLALSRAMRGLSFSPHHPELWHLAGLACLEFGAAKSAVMMMQHSLWINRAYWPARRDLEALAAFPGHDIKATPEPEKGTDQEGDRSSSL